MIKHILFDADGMIINRDGFFSERVINEFNLEADQVQAFFSKEWKAIVTGKADLKERLQPYLTSWNWNKSLDELLEYWFVSEGHINLQIKESIEDLKKQGIGCYLATNQEKYRLDFLAKEMGFGDLFDHLYSSCDLGFKKPEKEFFQHILKDLKVSNPNTVMFWDDTSENVLSAKELSIQGYLYTNYESYSDTLKELL